MTATTPTSSDESRNSALPAEARTEIWKGMYFRAQAGMERYLVSHFGYGAIDEWVENSAAMTAPASDRYKTEGTLPMAENLSRIMGDCWESDVRLPEHSAGHTRMEIDNCGILAYRKQAARTGVALTFDDPCREYCTKLLSRIAQKQDIDAEFDLVPNGCRWSLTAQGAQPNGTDGAPS